MEKNDEIKDILWKKSSYLKKILDSDIFECLQKISLGEYNSLSRFIIKSKIHWLSKKDILDNFLNNKLLYPSNMNFDKNREIENLFLEQLNSAFTFVELSPLMPIWTTNKIGNINQNQLISTLNNWEVLWEVSLPLILHSSKIILHTNSPKNIDINFWTIHRLIRNKRFENSFYSPHFKVMGLTSTIKSPTTNEEIDKKILYMLDASLEVLGKLKKQWADIWEISIEFGTIEVLYDIIKNWLNKNLDEAKNIVYAHKTWVDNGINILEANNINIPDKISSMEQLRSILDENNLKNHSSFFENIEGHIIKPLKQKYWEEIMSYFNLWRTSWAWHYKNLAFTLFVENKKSNTTIDIADWGVTNWSAELLWDKKIKNLVYCIGLELLSKEFFNF